MVDVEARIALLLDAGDHRGAITLAVRELGPELLGYIRAIVRDPTAANDVFATACEDMWRGVASFRRESSFRTWAYTLSWHAAARYLRDPYRKRHGALPTDAEIAQAVQTTTALHAKQASKDALAEIRASLAPDDQTLLILRIDRALSWSDVARVLDVEEPALRKRFERLKQRLRVELESRGLLDD